MGVVMVLLVGRGEADDGADDDESGFTHGFVGGLVQGRFQAIQVLASEHFQHTPAVGFKALAHIFGESQVGVALDGDVVVVVEADQFFEPQVPCEAGGLLAHAFHHVAVTDDGVGAVVHDLVTRTVELLRQEAFRHGHSRGVAKTLPQRTRGGLNANRMAKFRVAGRLGTPLAEVLQLLHRQVITREMQEAIEQHGGVPARQYETVAVEPMRILRIVL